MSNQDKITKEQANEIAKGCRKDGRWDLLEWRINALSPVSQDKPDYEVMWKTGMGYLFVMFVANKVSEKIMGALDEIERDHGGEGFLNKYTPPGAKEKPEGKDEEAQT